MLKSAIGLGLLACASAASAQSTTTDFGIRTIGDGSPVAEPVAAEPAGVSVVRTSGGGNLASAALIGSHWGRVTSMRRSVEHNRRVGGVRNSYHLSGRAMDVARRPGVSHWQIASALRQAGYHLIESLDEGDHSHFAFNFGGGSGWTPTQRAILPAKPAEVTQWRIVTASAAVFR